MTEGRVLVVEDDPSLREALCDTLQLAGYEAVQAGDGKAALHTLHSEDIRLVVTDVRTPYLDGYGLLRQIKASQPRVPVLVMTAYGTIDDAVRAMRDGASDYLVKPFEPDALLERVQRFLTAAASPDRCCVRGGGSGRRRPRYPSAAEDR
jgi:two-component system response regulator FlrC